MASGTQSPHFSDVVLDNTAISGITGYVFMGRN